MLLSCVALFVFCCVLALLLTWFVRNQACARGWAVPPRSDRHIHRKPIPRLGGVGIYSAFILTLALFHAGLRVLGRPSPFDFRIFGYIVAGGTIVFFLGLCDDIFSLSPWVKFGVQILAAAWIYHGGLRIVAIPMPFGLHHVSSTVGLVATIVWVVWITNAFNLIDGLDGLAAGSALFSTLVVFLNALITRDLPILLMSTVLAGCILGFLRFNFNPATIFLGDGGSLFIGFMLSALAIAGGQYKSPTLVAVAIPVVAFGLPVADTSLAIIRRFLSGKPLFTADREHIHHKLLDKGFSQRQVVLILYAVSAAFGLMSLFMRYPGGRAIGLVLVVVGTITLVGVQRLGYVEFVELSRVARRTIEQRQIIINNLELRRARQELARASSFSAVCACLKHAFEDNDFDAVELSWQAGGAHRIRDEHFSFSWRKTGEPGKSAWTLTLDLANGEGKKVGELSLYRSYSDRPLMVDINLLTSGFQTVLGGALVRATAEPRVSGGKAALIAASLGTV